MLLQLALAYLVRDIRISYFIIALFTILAIDKICLKSRYVHLEDQMDDLFLNYTMNELQYNKTKLKLNQVLKMYEKVVKERDDLLLKSKKKK